MSEYVLTARDLSYWYPGAERPALDGVHLDIAPGECVGLLGPTGAGKSTLLKCLAGIIPHYESRGRLQGSVRLHGKDVREFSGLAELTSSVGVVLQDPDAQLVNSRVREEIAWGPENKGVPVSEIRERTAEVGELLGVAPLLDRFTAELSGGEKQRVALSSILAMRPDVLLLDEPTSELDPAGSDDVFEAVRRLSAQGATVLIAEHKIEELVGLADRLLVLSEGRLIASGTPHAVLLGGARDGTVDPPQVLKMSLLLQEAGVVEFPRLPVTLEEAVELVERSGAIPETDRQGS